TYATDGSGKVEEGEVPSDLQERAEAIREQVMDAAAESDDDLMEKYLEEGELTTEEVFKGLRTGVVNQTLIPVICGSASHNIGTDRLLDFLTDEMPSPMDLPKQSAKKLDSEDDVELIVTAENDLAAIVFKTISESVGDLSFLRVYAGTLEAASEAYNANRKISERVGQIYVLNGMDRDEVSSIPAGDMGALVKLKDTHTGNTLCGKGLPLKVEPLEFPRPLIRIALEPKSRGDEDKISTGLQRIHEEDPSFIAGYDPELKQIIVEGQGELHLNVVLDKLKLKFGVEVETIQPRIPYRETIRSKAEGHHRHKKQSGGRGQFGEAYLRIQAQPRGDGFEYEDAVVGGAIPRNYIPAVEKGVLEAMERGVLAGDK
ncbi:MAG TPA: elongation factor G, partial [Candidatus Latescibacteria bacterium]|nr:elongation factor G [Candidatus Latescibacterota bacterium]